VSRFDNGYLRFGQIYTNLVRFGNYSDMQAVVRKLAQNCIILLVFKNHQHDHDSLEFTAEQQSSVETCCQKASNKDLRNEFTS